MLLQRRTGSRFGARRLSILRCRFDFYELVKWRAELVASDYMLRESNELSLYGYVDCQSTDTRHHFHSTCASSAP